MPPLPPKKSIGNMDLKFIESRRCFLDRFLKDVARNPTFYHSEELKAFIRPSTNDVEKALGLFPKLTTDQILERLSTVARLNDQRDTMEIKRMSDMLGDFVITTKKVFPILEVCITLKI